MSEQPDPALVEKFSPGTEWAYRARCVDDLVPVTMVRHGSKRPARVLVRFSEPSMEGREQWVPPNRLKVPWIAVGAFIAEEARWEALLALSPHGDSEETDAVERVFGVLVPEEVATLDWRGNYLTVSNLPSLSGLTGLPEDAFTGDPVGFADGCATVVSWPVVREAAKALAGRHPDAVLAALDKDERRFQREAIHGCHYGSGRRAWSIEPEDVVAYDQEHDRPVRDLLRDWCGAEAVSRADELRELRIEIKRVGDVAEAAIEALRSHCHTQEADRLGNALGQTVGILRADQ